MWSQRKVVTLTFPKTPKMFTRTHYIIRGFFMPHAFDNVRSF